MAGPGDSWATQQLVEFLASVSAYSTAESAFLGAAEAAAAALEAEVAAVVVGDRVEAAIGYPRGAIPIDELVEASRRPTGSLEVHGLGACRSASVPVDGDEPGWLVIARYGDEPLADEQEDLLRGMGRVLAMTLNTVHLLDSLHERQQQTIHQAFHDPLTELPNRALFLDRLGHTFARAERTGANAAVLFADLDGFKTVNDSLGHEAGDELLVLVGERMLGRLREADTAARFGGDEFAILLEEVEAGTAEQVAKRVLKSFEEPFRLRGRDVYITASIGIAEGRSEGDHMMRNADLAMYQAKSKGKGRYEVFEPGMHSSVVERLELEGDLKQAVERDELVLHYQPICRLGSGEVAGFEALLRWNHPTRGLIQPADFIPVAEESRQILALGEWVLDEACRQAAEWQGRAAAARPLGPLTMSVNISGVQLDQEGLLDQVRTAIGRAGLAPSSLTLEVTETALMADTAASIRKLDALKQLGVRLSVDDFGTGYSSLEYLRKFPIDSLKVAKSFVDGLRGAAEGAPLVQAILDLADSFGLEVVAEGIELAEQHERLVAMGFRLGQGFYFARPADVRVAESMIQRGSLAPTR
jgi:diguanylate cyclase (GGDEF)-like protein